ncbi:DUF1990 family protein [Deinococcus sp. Arct2-2]|uniref:DUF1990 family protein n=1 Tax=Deinococcus sp. Arct2-2 TaxID=2568653 RepID=UPI0010A35F94|nr:DUF1990 family protein [Deinococcus sp. Arct2-2]THF71657.1 DUF1990 family protein [Deinococcus sp. Arct2-2]
MFRRTTLLALPALALTAFIVRGPPDPLRPSTPADGVGPLTRRRYWAEVEGATRTPQDMAADWRSRLPQHAPKALAWFRGLDHAAPPIAQGDRLWILLLGTRRARVIIEHVDDLGFRARTLRLHPDAGTSEFRVLPGSQAGRMVVQVESVMRTHSRFDRVAYILGVHAAQRITWERVLDSVVAYSGGRIVNRGHESVELPMLPHVPALVAGQSA